MANPALEGSRLGLEAEEAGSTVGGGWQSEAGAVGRGANPAGVRRPVTGIGAGEDAIAVAGRAGPGESNLFAGQHGGGELENGGE